MGLETATFIDGLVATNPVGATDPKSQGDDHIRLIKSTIKATFANVTGAVTVTHTELNRLAGVTAPVEDMRGLAYTSQAGPYSVVAGDIGTVVNITNSSTITLGNLADKFACHLAATNGNLTLTSSNGTLFWYTATGSIASGNVTVLSGSIVTIHRVSGNWRVFGGGIQP